MILDRLSAAPAATQRYFEHGDVLVEFYARWCGSCRALTRTLRSVEPLIDIPVIRVDIDDDPALSARYGILGVPQLLFLSDGIERDRVAGSIDESEFAAWHASHRKNP
jgi:thioredoxin 1